MVLIKRSLIIESKLNLSNLLEKVKPVEVESISEENNKITLNFYDYISLYFIYNEFKKNKIGKLKVNEIEKVPENLLNAYYSGATRGIYLTELDDDMDDNFFLSIINKESVETIRYFSDKKVINIYFYSISECMENAKIISSHERFSNKKIRFTKVKSVEKDFCSIHTRIRTIYIGNLYSDINPFDILKSVKGGQIFGLKVLKDRKCGFLTFLNPYSASAFIALCNIEPLVVNGHKLKITVGNNSLISFSATYKIFEGSTRVLKIKNFKNEMLSESPEEYEIENINDSEFTIVHFLSINKAYEVADRLIKMNVDVEFVEDPCAKIKYDDIILYLQQKEFSNLKK